jgi:hypothetical protein
MKTKVTTVSKFTQLDKQISAKKKQKSLRPMRSMVAVRSFKPKTSVAALSSKVEDQPVNN